MSTAAQTSANQANAIHSTGPVTAAGKAVSSRNRTIHGFRSSTLLLPGDDPAEYQQILSDLEAYFPTRGLSETLYVREMADAEWRLRRVRTLMESALTRHIETLAARHPEMDPTDLQSLAIETLAQTGCGYSTWLRYEAKFERQFQRANDNWVRHQNNCHRAAKGNFFGAINAENGIPTPSPAEPAALRLAPPSKKLGSNVQTTPAQSVGQPKTPPVGLPKTPPVGLPKTPRNAPCPCKSGLKFKKCCGGIHQSALEKAA